MRETGHHNAKALDGVKVIDFSWVAVGPVTSSYLADHGATVIKIESHTHPDIGRVIGPFKGPATINSSGFFTHANSSKYSACLNLRKEKGRKIALELIKWSDILVENTTPGTMKRLGLDYQTVRSIKPEIIYVSISMHGQTGPNFSSPGYGSLASALSGISFLSGWPDRGPAPPQGAYVDYITPRFAVISILAALDYRRRRGKGQAIDVALTETGTQFVLPVIMNYFLNSQIPERKGDFLSPGIPHGAFPCKGEDRWIAISIQTDEEWKALRKTMGSPPWTSRFTTLQARKENQDELERLISQWTQNYSPEELTNVLQQAGIPASPVESNQDLFQDPQLKYRKHFMRLEHAIMGSYVHDSHSFRFSKTPAKEFAAPLIGEHNEYVYNHLLGLSDDEISDLMAEGVITTESDLPGNW